MTNQDNRCPDCDALQSPVDRRRFMQAAGVAAVGMGSFPVWAQAKDAAAKKVEPESNVKRLYDTLTANQKKVMCFDWDHKEGKLGLLRTRVENNWHITKPAIGSDFYTKEQQALIRDIYEGLYSPEWVSKIDKQLKDDAGGYGRSQNIAIFGRPGDEKFEFVMTGRHLTMRCDGNSAEHVAFGGPIFYGHAASGFNEGPNHPGNVFWPQALQANKVFEMLDGKQRKVALLKDRPDEWKVGFHGAKGGLPGIPISDLSSDQKEEVQKTLQKLLEPYRKTDRAEALACLKEQGGLDACHLAFYQDGDIGKDGVWDNWRLEGPSFVWYFRGEPHVHVWVNVANDPSVKLNT